MPYHVGQPLLYGIDDWHQLGNARSNTDPTLRIRVSDFLNSDVFEGIRIQVVHPQYGILLSVITRASGRLVSYDPQSFLTTDEILKALKHLGFDIRINDNPTLNEATFKFLEGALAAGYTHVRWAIKKHKHAPRRHLAMNCLEPDCERKTELIVICFNENKRPEFCNQYLRNPIVEFGGDIMQVSPNDNPKLDFSWLQFPMHIESVLTDNLKSKGR